MIVYYDIHLLDQHGPAVANTIALHMMLFVYMAAAQNMNENSGVGICHLMSRLTLFGRHIGMKKPSLTCKVLHGHIQRSDQKHEIAPVEPPVATSSHMATLQSAAPKRPQRTPDAGGCFFFWKDTTLCAAPSFIWNAQHSYLTILSGCLH